MMYEKDIVAYLLRECGGLHPFHISRIVALLDMKYLEEKGKKLTEVDYQKTPYGFYSNKIPEILNELPVEKVEEEGYKYLKLKDDANFKIELPKEIEKKINELLDEICELSDEELNKRIIQSKYYQML